MEIGMKTCKTCKFWEIPENQYGEVPGTGKCNAMPQFWDASEWVEDSDSRKIKPEYAGKLAFVRDGSDYYAALMTMPEFGCALHEKAI